ncbi:antirestriction protein [Aquimarina sp. U1-2]|uniref:antirestriction protein n=1 Tax=Aquimarina sp. U1-2 TaxID=2823141 RepID=UPI001AEC9132|nr:antirestriction protein [Aquimarina sp. U1-2]MBP2831283.1 antirestriction protein [Aquimarina sp. U1-2]
MKPKISWDNYEEQIKKVNIKKLPLLLQDGHQFFEEARDFYHSEKAVKQAVDLYLERLNLHLEKTALPIQLVPTQDILFVKRFIGLNGKTKTKRQLLLFIQTLQKAIRTKTIRKNSVLAEDIVNIQQKLIDQYNQMNDEELLKIEINGYWLNKLKDLLKEKDHTDLGLLPKKSQHTNSLSPKKQPLFDSMDQIDDQPAANSFKLEGDLGSFLGDLERFELAMTIEGDQGGGKTRFAYQLADAFADIGNTIAIFSLEIGSKSDLIRRMREDYLKPENLRKVFITDRIPKGLKSIQEAAKDLDVIILDSWNKTGLPSLEFDKLRKAHPNAIFIVIFQRTTQKMIRGGTAPLFDAGINIEVVKVDDSFFNNYAVTTKNRYGITGIQFNISRKEIIHQSSESEFPVENESSKLLENELD